MLHGWSKVDGYPLGLAGQCLIQIQEAGYLTGNRRLLPLSPGIVLLYVYGAAYNYFSEPHSAALYSTIVHSAVG